MKIISKFRDYYDIGLSMGMDESIIYVRKPEIVTPEEAFHEAAFKKFELNEGRRWFITAHSLQGSIGVVGFCGKLYPFFVFPESSDGLDTARFYYDLDGNEKVDLVKETDKRVSTFLHNSFDVGIDKIERLLKREPDSNDSLFHELNAPSFIILPRNTPSINEVIRRVGSSGEVFGRVRKPVVIKNPILKGVGFYKMVDAYTAFQELSMYMSGVLGDNGQPPVTISDEDLRDAKGFNERSFKKDPTKKRGK